MTDTNPSPVGLTGRPAVDEIDQSAESAALRTYIYLDHQIRSGQIAGGDRLPSERALATTLGVSRGTVRQALTALERSNIVEAVPNSGWFARPDRTYVEANELQSFTQFAASRGLAAQARVLNIETRAASFDEAELFRIAPATLVVDVDRVRMLDRQPVCVQRAIIPASLFGDFDPLALDQHSLTDLFAHSGFPLTRADSTMRADLATALVAELLELPVGAAVLIADEIAYTVGDRPIARSELIYRGDSYRFKASVYRRRANAAPSGAPVTP